MELKLQPPFLTLVLTFLVGILPGILFAQESELVSREYHTIETHTSAPSNESLENEEVIMEEEKSSFKPQSNTFVSKDSIVVRSPITNKPSAKTKTNNDAQKSLTDQKPAEKNNEDQEKEDSILSFNFLYYIFQKFKLSDIVDK